MHLQATNNTRRIGVFISLFCCKAVAVNREEERIRVGAMKVRNGRVKKLKHSASAIGALSRGSLGTSIPEYSVIPLDLTGLRQLLHGVLRRLLLPLLPRNPRLLYLGRLHYPDVMSQPPDAEALPLLQHFMREEGIRFALAPGLVQVPGWVHFPTEPLMQLQLHSEWGQFSDYLSALNSKHRVKARRVLSISESLQFRTLDANALHEHKPMIDALFIGLKQRVTFMLGALNTHFFEEQKEYYGDKLHLRLYETAGKPVGFISLLEEGGTLYALHACSDPMENKRLHIYQRMLYDVVDLAISLRCQTLHLGRTAAGIKSSIGAEPLPAYYSVYARTALLRSALRILARWARPDQEPIRKAFR